MPRERRRERGMGSTLFQVLGKIGLSLFISAKSGPDSAINPDFDHFLMRARARGFNRRSDLYASVIEFSSSTF